MQFKTLATTSIAAAALGLSFSASAAVINFDQQNAESPAGSVSYDGNGGGLVGTDISFDRINLNGGSVPAGNQSVLDCVSCVINFTTGNNIEEGQTSRMWSFGGGGTFELTGNAVADNGATIADGTLFSGIFGNNPQLVVKTGESSFNASLSGTDDFNADLAGYFGLDAEGNYDFSTTEIALGNATFSDDGAFDSGKLTNADVAVEPTRNDVPEPAAIGLFAIGMALVLGGLGFRRKQAGQIG